MTETTTKKFPVAGTGVRLKNHLVGGGELVTLRMPTDDEYAAYRRRAMQVRGQADEELALADGLFRELAEDGATGVEPDDADYLLGRLMRFDLTAAHLDGERGDFVVRAQAMGGLEVGMRFKLPSVRRLREESAGLTLPEAVRLFDEFVTETSGYEGAVPNYHKHSAALALREGLYQLAAEAETVDFFDRTAPTTGSAVPAA